VFKPVLILFISALVSSVALLFSPNIIIQGFLVLMIWFYIFYKLENFRKSLTLILLGLSSFSFVISSNYIEELGIESSFFYELASFSPLYLLLRSYSTLWNSQWMYLDTPFHFYFESSSLTLQAWVYFIVVLMVSIKKKNA
jgi:hypothetical protein